MTTPYWLRISPAFLREKLRNRHNLQKIISNMVWLFIDKALRMGVGLFIGAWVARFLGPEEFGMLSYSIAFAALFSPIASLGLDSIVVRDIVRDPSAQENTLGSAFGLQIAGGTMAFFLAVGVAYLTRRGEALTCWLVGIAAAGMIVQALDIIDFWFQSQIQSRYVVMARNAAFIFVSILRVVLIIFQAPLLAFALAGLLEIMIASSGLLLAYRSRGLQIASWRCEMSRARVLLRDSWPLMLSSIVGIIYLRIDQIMIGNLVGDAEVGIYAAAVRLAEVWYFIPMSVLSSVLPSIVTAKSTNEDLFLSRLQKLYNWMSFMSYAIAIPTTFLAKWVVSILFGPGYARAGPMLAALIWAGLFVNLGVARSSFLTANNWTGVAFFCNLIGCISNIGLNLFLIPRFGGMGAVMASLFSYWLAAHGSCYFYRPMFRTGNMMLKSMVYPRIW